MVTIITSSFEVCAESFGTWGIEFAGDPVHSKVLDAEESTPFRKILSPLTWCMAGSNTEAPGTEYAFLAALRWQIGGVRDVVLTSAQAMVAWASLQKQQSAASGPAADIVPLAEALKRFQNLSQKEATSYLSDSAHWVVSGQLLEGDVLYIPAGCMCFSRSQAEMNIGIKIGAVVPSDSSALSALSQLHAWSVDWYKGTMTHNLGNTFTAGIQLHNLDRRSPTTPVV